jgi:hypothetical protein
MAHSLDDIRAAKQLMSSRFLKQTVMAGLAGLSRTRLVATAIAHAPSTVHAVGVGYKIAGDELTETLCVRFYVSQKLPTSLLPPTYTLPEQVDGIATDVIESAPAFLSQSVAAKKSRSKKADKIVMSLSNCSQDRQKRQRPMVAGISAAVRTITAGTLGAFCRSTQPGDDPNATHILSNNHVLADVNKAPIGEDIYQPSPTDGGMPPDAVADLTRYVRLDLGGTLENHVDAAIAKLRPGASYDRQICSIGPLQGVAMAALNMKVRKHGRTTGLTHGQISDVDYDALVGMDHANPNVVAKFVDQIRIEALAPYAYFGKGGDSGSLVVTLDGAVKAVGLYFAGPSTGEYGIANHIGDVTRELQVALL